MNKMNSTALAMTDDYKPELVAYQSGRSNEFVAIVANSRQTKKTPDGRTATSTTATYQNSLTQWPGKPVFANHLPSFKIGSVVQASINSIGQLMMRFRVTDEAAADLVRNDAFSGFSIAWFPGTLNLNAANEVESASPWHLAVTFFPVDPVCPKGTCDLVVFSKNGTARSCACQEGVHKDSITALLFSKQEYTQESAMEWIKSHNMCCGSDPIITSSEELITFSKEPLTGSGSDNLMVLSSGVQARIQVTQGEHVNADSELLTTLTENAKLEVPISVNEKASTLGGTPMTEKKEEKKEAPKEEPKKEEKAPDTNTETPKEEKKEAPKEDPVKEKEEALKQLTKERDDLKRLLEGKDEEKAAEIRTREEKIASIELDVKKEIAKTLPELTDELRDALGLKPDQTWLALPLREMRLVSAMKPAKAAETEDDAEPVESRPPKKSEAKEDPQILAARAYYEKQLAPFARKK